MEKSFIKILFGLFFLVTPACQDVRPPPETSFVTFGDWGSGSDEQREVARGIGEYCGGADCDFVLTLGDNFYEGGVLSVEDSQWTEKYREVYGPLQIPFFAMLGNHDMQGNYQAQIDYTEFDPYWNMPGEYYSILLPLDGRNPEGEIFVINSSHFTPEAMEWLGEAIAGSEASWKILALHTPVISNGPHGDDFDGINNLLLPIICNRVDLVIAGHEHLFSHLREEIEGCLVEQVIIGTGGADLFEPNTADPRVLSTGKFYGFGWLKVTKTQIIFKMIGPQGETYYETEWVKKTN